MNLLSFLEIYPHLTMHFNLNLTVTFKWTEICLEMNATRYAYSVYVCGRETCQNDNFFIFLHIVYTTGGIFG